MALDIFEDEEFKKQSRSVRADVVRNYAKQEIAADPEFKRLSPEERRGILQRYFKDNLPEAEEDIPFQPSALEAYPELLKTPLPEAFQNIPADTVTGMIEEERKKPLLAQLGGLAQFGMMTTPKAFAGKLPVPPLQKTPTINLLKPKITGIKGQAPIGVPVPRFFPPEPEILSAKELAMQKTPIPELSAKNKAAILSKAQREGGGWVVGEKPTLGSETVKTTLFPGMEKKVKLAPSDVPKTPLNPQRVGPSISEGGSLRPDTGKSQFELIQEKMTQAKGRPQYAAPREEFIVTPTGTAIPPTGIMKIGTLPPQGPPELSAFEKAKQISGTEEPLIPPVKKTIPPVSLVKGRPAEGAFMPPVPKFAKKPPDRAPEWVYGQKEPIVYQYEGYDPNLKRHAYTAQIQGGEALPQNNSSVIITPPRLKSGMIKPEDKIIGGPFATEGKLSSGAIRPSTLGIEEPIRPIPGTAADEFGALHGPFVGKEGDAIISNARILTELPSDNPNVRFTLRTRENNIILEAEGKTEKGLTPTALAFLHVNADGTTVLTGSFSHPIGKKSPFANLAKDKLIEFIDFYTKGKGPPGQPIPPVAKAPKLIGQSMPPTKAVKPPVAKEPWKMSRAEAAGQKITGYIQAKKRVGSGGQYELWYTGTRNKVEITDGELYRTPTEAKLDYQLKTHKAIVQEALAEGKLTPEEAMSKGYTAEELGIKPGKLEPGKTPSGFQPPEELYTSPKANYEIWQGTKDFEVREYPKGITDKQRTYGKADFTTYGHYPTIENAREAISKEGGKFIKRYKEVEELGIKPAEAPKPAAISPELEPLAQEARKYKSAEEFVKAKRKGLYANKKAAEKHSKELTDFYNQVTGEPAMPPGESGAIQPSTLLGLGAGAVGAAVLPKMPAGKEDSETEQRLKKLTPEMQLPEFKSPWSILTQKEQIPPKSKRISELWATPKEPGEPLPRLFEIAPRKQTELRADTGKGKPVPWEEQYKKEGLYQGPDFGRVGKVGKVATEFIFPIRSEIAKIATLPHEERMERIKEDAVLLPLFVIAGPVAFSTAKVGAKVLGEPMKAIAKPLYSFYRNYVRKIPLEGGGDVIKQKGLGAIRRVITYPHTVAKRHPAYRDLYEAGLEYIERVPARIKYDLAEKYQPAAKLSKGEWVGLEDFMIKNSLDRKPYITDEQELIRAGLNANQIRAYKAATETLSSAFDTYEKHYLAGVDRDMELLGKAADEDIEAVVRAAKRHGLDFEKIFSDLELPITKDSIVLIRQKLYGDIKVLFKGMRLKGYVPLSRFGDWAVEIPGSKFFKGYRAQRETEHDARVVYNQIKRQEIPRDILGMDPALAAKLVQLPEKAKEIPKELYKGIDVGVLAALKGLSQTRHQMTALTEMFARSTNKGWATHILGRKDTPGFSRDINRNIQDYIIKEAHYLGNREYRSIAMKELEKLAQSSTKGLYDYARNQVDYLITKPKEAEALRSFLFDFYIGGVIKTSINNAAQNALTGAPVLSKTYPSGAVYRELLAAYKLVARPKTMDKDLAKAVNVARREGLLEAKLVEEMSGGKKAGLENVPGYSGLSEALRFFFKKTEEKANRETMLVTGFNLARKYQPEKGFDYWFKVARDGVNEAHYLYGRLDRPPIARGKVGATALTLRSFQYQTLSLWKEMIKDKQFGPLSQSLGTLAALGGLRALPGATATQLIAEELGYDPVGYLWKKGGKGGEMLTNGIAAGAGMDFQASMNLDPMQELEYGKGKSWENRVLSIVGGPAAGLAMKIQKGGAVALSHEKGAKRKAIEQVSPSFIHNFLQAEREYREGVTTKTGKPIALPGKPQTLTTGEAINKGVLGIPSMRVAKGFHAFNRVGKAIRQGKAGYNRTRARIAAAYRNFDLKEVNRLQRQWNDRAKEYVEQIKARGYRDLTVFGYKKGWDEFGQAIMFNEADLKRIRSELAP